MTGRPAPADGGGVKVWRGSAPRPPSLRGRDQQLIAASLLAYNIGAAGYCRSTVDRRFDAGQWRAGCDAFRMWNKAGGRVVRGLVNRREFERTICLKGLPA